MIKTHKSTEVSKLYKFQLTSCWLRIQFIKLVCMSTKMNNNKLYLLWSTRDASFTRKSDCHIFRINTKNCSLSIVLTATDQKPQKSLESDFTNHHIAWMFRHKVRVSVSVTVTLGLRDTVMVSFRDTVRVRAKVRISFRIVTFIYSAWGNVTK